MSGPGRAEAPSAWSGTCCTTVHAVNEDRGREIYLFLRDQWARGSCSSSGSSSALPRRPCTWPTADGGGASETGCSTPGRQPGDGAVGPTGGYGRFLIDVFEDWVRHDVGEDHEQMFDVALANWYSEPAGLCVHSETCGLALALEHTGDLYSCDHFVEPACELGNIRDKTMLDLITSPAADKFGLAKRDGLPGSAAVRRALRLPRRMPEGPVHRHARGRAGAALPAARATRVSSVTSARQWRRCAACCAQARLPRRSSIGTPKRTPNAAATACRAAGWKWKKCHGAPGSHGRPRASIPVKVTVRSPAL